MGSDAFRKPYDLDISAVREGHESILRADRVHTSGNDVKTDLSEPGRSSVKIGDGQYDMVQGCQHRGDLVKKAVVTHRLQPVARPPSG